MPAPAAVPPAALSTAGAPAEPPRPDRTAEPGRGGRPASFPRLADAEHGGDRLALAIAGATLGLRDPARHALARRMRMTASAVLLFAAGACRPGPAADRRLRRGAARRALGRLAAQVALAERLGYIDPATALRLLEEQTAVRLALEEPSERPAGAARAGTPPRAAAG